MGPLLKSINYLPDNHLNIYFIFLTTGTHDILNSSDFSIFLGNSEANPLEFLRRKIASTYSARCLWIINKYIYIGHPDTKGY